MSTFPRIDPRFDPLAWEPEVLALWRRDGVFEQTVTKDAPKGELVFYDGPPTANNVPHFGHLITRVMKDVFPRYWTMRGYRVRRKAGWDTHGLPVEIEIEKKLGITSRAEIEAIVPGDRSASIAEFNRQCKDSVLTYEATWREVSERFGHWIDLSDPYFTFSNTYIESEWWILARMYEHGVLYQGHKILPYGPQAGTTYSSHEVALNFKDDVADPSIYAKVAVARPGQETSPVWAGVPAAEPVHLLVWTTTPWTLLSNVSIAVHPEVDYVRVRPANERSPATQLVVARDRLESLRLDGAHVEATFPGRALQGVRYEPIFPEVFAALAREGDAYRLGAIPRQAARSEDAFRVALDDYVTTTDGTGLVHQAPAFGEDDYRVGQREGLPFVSAVTAAGAVKPAAAAAFDREVRAAVNAGRLAPQFATEYSLHEKYVKDFGVGEERTADPVIYNFLRYTGQTLEVPGKSGLKAYRHSYPFCWRHDTPLIYYATDSWFIRTTAFRDQLVTANRAINWVPEHVREGRMGDWLENVVDWALSRRRYWGTPLPIWVNDRTQATICVGSFEELFRLAGRDDEYRALLASGQLYDPEREGGFNPHRPYIDDFTWQDGEGGTWRRVEEVIDAWFDSGAMPYAQIHYPFDKACRPLRGNYPADFISEAVDQTRGWFYTLHAISVFLSTFVEEVRADARVETTPAYRSCIVLGHILDEQGRKMSKRLGNVLYPQAVMERAGADAVRWYLLSATQPWTNTRFSERLLKETTQRLLIPLHNALSFFTIYAEIDGYHPTRTPDVPFDQRSDLDRWILIALERTAERVVEHMDRYEVVEACGVLEGFVDRLTNWYIRRSRSRFWKPARDTDKHAAYHTLWEVLVGASRLIAPFTPFIAEHFHQLIARPFGGADSVHLEGLHEPRGYDDPELERGMEDTLRVVELGRAARAKHQLRVRQPLARATIVSEDVDLRRRLAPFQAIVADELNIKAIEWAERADAFVSYEIKPNYKRLGKRLGPAVKAVAQQIARADARALKRELDTNGSVELDVSGSPTRLDAEDLEIRFHHQAGTTAEADRDVLLVLDTRIDQGLEREGVAREFINRVQTLRKTLNLDYVQRIRLTVDAADTVRTAVTEHRDLIMREVLAVGLDFAQLSDGHDAEIDGTPLRLDLATAGHE